MCTPARTSWCQRFRYSLCKEREMVFSFGFLSGRGWLRVFGYSPYRSHGMKRWGGLVTIVSRVGRPGDLGCFPRPDERAGDHGLPATYCTRGGPLLHREFRKRRHKHARTVRHVSLKRKCSPPAFTTTPRSRVNRAWTLQGDRPLFPEYPVRGTTGTGKGVRTSLLPQSERPDRAVDS